MNLQAVKSDLETLLRSLGAMVNAGFQDAHKSVQAKTDANDLVTQYDVEVNKRIEEHLLQKYPDISIISEELPTIERDSEYAFVVDPIDGTRNFVRGIPIFFMGIGLVRNNKPVLSITYNPASEEMFWAIQGEGAYLNGRRLQVSDRTLELADVQVRAFARPALVAPILEHLVDKVCQIKNDMCCHYELSGVAANRFDGVILAFSYPWDFCHYLLVEEAGGKVTDCHGEPYDISKDNIIASNGVIHDALIAAARKKPS